MTHPSTEDPVKQHSKNGTRAFRACDRCRVKKSKCDGNAKCRRCKEIDNPCTYTDTEGRRARRDYSRINEIKNEALQRLYKACRRQGCFPGILPEEKNGAVTANDILRGLGLIGPGMKELCCADRTEIKNETFSPSIKGSSVDMQRTQSPSPRPASARSKPSQPSEPSFPTSFPPQCPAREQSQWPRVFMSSELELLTPPETKCGVQVSEDPSFVLRLDARDDLFRGLNSFNNVDPRTISAALNSPTHSDLNCDIMGFDQPALNSHQVWCRNRSSLPQFGVITTNFPVIEHDFLAQSTGSIESTCNLPYAGY